MESFDSISSYQAVWKRAPVVQKVKAIDAALKSVVPAPTLVRHPTYDTLAPTPVRSAFEPRLSRVNDFMAVFRLLRRSRNDPL
jgi:hypothetical protein